MWLINADQGPVFSPFLATNKAIKRNVYGDIDASNYRANLPRSISGYIDRENIADRRLRRT